MNMKKLLAGVVGVTVLMSNVAFAAVTTTTTYNATTGKVNVSTEVSGLTNGSMVTYVLYGNKGQSTTPFADATGAITPTTATAPDEANIIYIDQENNVTGGTKTFTAPGLNVGEAYGAKIIVGTDNDTDAGDVAVAEPYTGDMYTLKLDANAVDYTAKVEVNMGGSYIKEYSLAANDSVNVPVGAECQVKVTFKASDGKVISKAYVAGVEITNAANLNNSLYAEGQEYILSAEVANETNPALITVSEPIKAENSVTYLVNVNQFENLYNTGLKIEFNGHEFNNLVPVNIADKGYYAIRIIDETKNGELGMASAEYTVTAFVNVDGAKVYDGDEGSSSYLNVTYAGDNVVDDEKPVDVEE